MVIKKNNKQHLFCFENKFYVQNHTNHTTTILYIGLDHMSALSIIRKAQKNGEIIREFSSVCGGLPAPEAADNLLGYKFSWSPMGVLSASQNSARFMKNSNVCANLFFLFCFVFLCVFFSQF